LQLTTHLSTPKGRKAELAWLVTHNGRFTHVSGHPSATGRVQDRETTPAKDRRSTTEPRNQPQHLFLGTGWKHTYFTAATTHSDCVTHSSGYHAPPVHWPNNSFNCLGHFKNFRMMMTMNWWKKEHVPSASTRKILNIYTQFLLNWSLSLQLLNADESGLPRETWLCWNCHRTSEGQMLILPAIQLCQSTEGNSRHWLRSQKIILHWPKLCIVHRLMQLCTDCTSSMLPRAS